MYELKEQYLTGVEQIDNQHRKIFKLADDAYQLLKDENILFKDERLFTIISGLRDYTQYHFTEEELYMEQIQYAELEFQKAQHRKFILELDKLSQETVRVSLENQDDVIDKVLAYLANWLQEHIEHFDMKIK